MIPAILRRAHWWAITRLDYHVGEAIRFHYFRRYVVPLVTPQTRRVVDAGSGAGKHAFYLARTFPHLQVIGLDNREEVVRRTQAQARERGLGHLHFLTADLTRPLPLRDADLIYSFDVVEHIPDDRAALAHMLRSLRPGGWLAVHTPLTPQRHWFRRFDLDRLVNPLHAREGYRRGELEGKIEEAGGRVIRRVYTHGPWGTLAWELWKWSRYRLLPTLLLLPLIRLLITVEAHREPKEGNCVLVLAQRPVEEEE